MRVTSQQRMIEAISTERWQEAQAAESTAVSYDQDCSRRAFAYVFDYLGMTFNQEDKQIIEVGCGGVPAVSFCKGFKAAMVVEPLWFPLLKTLSMERGIVWDRRPFEDIPLTLADEVWIFNCLQHVRDPEVVVSKAKRSAPIVRFFEPVDYPTCVYHPHTFTQQDFERWFGDCVKHYIDRLPGFFDADCVYGTWNA